MEWLAVAAIIPLILVVRYVIKRRIEEFAEEAYGDPIGKKPFCPEEYAENKAHSQDWDLQQAMRKAGLLEKKGKLGEAVAILIGVRNSITHKEAKEVLDNEIRRLGGTPPPDAESPKPAPGPPPAAAPDPYADRM
jgi:hypothetical protein